MSPNWEKRQVLVAEDSDDDFFLLTRAFRKANFINPVQRAVDGKDVIQYLSGIGRYHDREVFPVPYILLLDLKMPVVHGFDVLSWIRQHETVGLLPVVIFSSSQQAVDIDESYKKGANGYVMKSTSVAGLVDVVSAIHTYWLKTNWANR